MTFVCTFGINADAETDANELEEYQQEFFYNAETGTCENSAGETGFNDMTKAQFEAFVPESLNAECLDFTNRTEEDFINPCGITEHSLDKQINLRGSNLRGSNFQFCVFNADLSGADILEFTGGYFSLKAKIDSFTILSERICVVEGMQFCVSDQGHCKEFWNRPCIR